MVRRTSVGVAHSDQYKKYNNNSNNSNDINNNKCKKVFECLVFIENVIQCSRMSSELRIGLNHKRSTNLAEILEIYLIELTTIVFGHQASVEM